MESNSNPSSLKRHRRKKLFPGMIPSHHPLRQHSSSRLARDLHVEAQIALSVGFPVDSLIEEEIESNVLPTVGSPSQPHYIIVRNHIISLWRSNPSLPLSPLSAASAIRSEHHPLVSAAHSFLRRHAYINFGILPNNPPIPIPPPSTPSIIVVGAGFAGLGAARQLMSLGFKVVVLEARMRPGGRVLTRKMECGGVAAAADLGGSVLTGINGNPLGVLARQMGLPLHKVRDKCPLYLPDGRPVDRELDSRIEVAFNGLLEKVCKLREAIMDELKSVDVSLGEALEAFRRVYGVAGTAEERWLLDWHLANLEYANAAVLSDLSLAFWDQDDPYEMGGDHCFIPGGNARFVRALAEGIPIFYGKVVKGIRYGSDGVVVCVDDGQSFRGDMVVCSVSLGVLKKGVIEFVPSLPARKKEAIERLGFGVLNKVAMLFPYDFWGGSIDTFGHLTGDSCQRGEFFLFYSYSSVSGGPLLVGLVAGESAISFEKCSPTESVERALSILRGIFAPKGIQVPDPLQVVCTRWGADKFTYGSYSYVAVGSSGDDYDILAESIGNGRVFFAGEATNRRYPATMHGALLSGFREAANIHREAGRSKLHMMDRTDVRREDFDLDNLFKSPDLSFGKFAALHDPTEGNLDSTSLLRVAIGERKVGSSAVFLYGLILKRHVLELAGVDGDDERLSLLCRSFDIKLVGINGLGSQGEDLILKIKAAKGSKKSGIMNGIHHS